MVSANKQSQNIASELEGALRRWRDLHLIKHNRWDLNPGELLLMRVFATLDHQQPVFPSDLARQNLVTLSAVTHHLNTLEEKGLITRSISPQDRRRILITLTPAGKELVAKCRKKVKGLIDHLGQVDCQELIRLINRMADYLESTAGSPR